MIRYVTFPELQQLEVDIRIFDEILISDDGSVSRDGESGWIHCMWRAHTLARDQEMPPDVAVEVATLVIRVRDTSDPDLLAEVEAALRSMLGEDAEAGTFRPGF